MSVGHGIVEEREHLLKTYMAKTYQQNTRLIFERTEVHESV